MIDLDELTNLRADVAPMTKDSYVRGLSRVQAAQAAAPPRTRSHRPRYALIAAVAAVLVVAAGGVAVGSRGPADSASAATVLNDAAARALLKPTLHPKRGQFVYQRVNALGNSYANSVEYWIPADSTGQETICVTNNGCTVIPYDKNGSRDQGLPYDVLSSLPSTGTAMLAFLRVNPITSFEKSTGYSTDLAIWNTASHLGDLLPPAQQAALFQALALLSDAHLQGRVTTFDGQPGIAIGIYDPRIGANRQLVFNADTHEYIGERIVEESTSFNTSKTITAIVDRAQQRP